MDDKIKARRKEKARRKSRENTKKVKKLVRSPEDQERLNRHNYRKILFRKF